MHKSVENALRCMNLAMLLVTMLLYIFKIQREDDGNQDIVTTTSSTIASKVRRPEEIADVMFQERMNIFCAYISRAYCNVYERAQESVVGGPIMYTVHLMIFCVMGVIALVLDDLIQNTNRETFTWTLSRHTFFQPFHRANYHEVLQVALCGVIVGILIGGTFAPHIQFMVEVLWSCWLWVEWIGGGLMMIMTTIK